MYFIITIVKIILKNCYQFVVADCEDSEVDQILDVRRKILEVVVAEMEAKKRF